MSIQAKPFTWESYKEFRKTDHYKKAPIAYKVLSFLICVYPSPLRRHMEKIEKRMIERSEASEREQAEFEEIMAKEHEKMRVLHAEFEEMKRNPPSISQK